VVYDIEMYTPSDSQEIRDAFGLFWRKKSGKKLPSELKGVTLSNVTTFPTRVRVRLLKEVCRRHQAANPDLSCFVTNYLARPELKIRDRKGPMLSYTYTETVQKLSHHLTTDFLSELSKFAKTNLSDEEIRERFLVLSPDFISPPTVANDDGSAMSVDMPPEPSVNQAILVSVPAPIPLPSASQADLVSNPAPGSLTVQLDPAAIGLPVLSAGSWADEIPPQASTEASATLQSGYPAPLESGNDPDSLQKRNRDRYVVKPTPY